MEPFTDDHHRLSAGSTLLGYRKRLGRGVTAGCHPQSSMWWAVNVDKDSAQLTGHKVRQIIVKVLDQLQHAVREPLRVVVTIQQPFERAPQQLHGASRLTT